VNRGGRKVTRWNRRLLFGAMVVLVPVLAGCEAGFNAPTLQYHPANLAANTTQHGISFSDAFVLGAAVNGPEVAGGRAGVFLSLFSSDGDRLVSVEAPGTATSTSITGGSVNLPAQSLVDLSGPVPQVVLAGLANPLEGGQAVTLNFTFAKAGTITLSVPVEPQSFEFATYSPPPTPSPSPSATGKKKGHPRVPVTGSASASASASPSTTP
jgi:copper(I)-binding protein